MALWLAACGMEPMAKPVITEAGPWNDIAPTGKEKALIHSDFSMEIVRFSDDRPPRLTAQDQPDRYQYRYEPDELLHGVTAHMPAMFDMYMSYRPKMPKDYKVELTLKNLESDVLVGSFWSGPQGRYRAAIHVGVLVRRSDSTVALRKDYWLDLVQRRLNADRRGPTKEEDAQALYSMLDAITRSIAADIAWDIKTGDARHWKPQENTYTEPRLYIVPRAEMGGPRTIDATTAPSDGR
ncbi:MAG: hypothetical protein GC129_05805 [Proteobacteria bacterium]|nr:hypothetical protein [Pseudomonadota bacterium]